MARVVVITPNPAIDVTYRVAEQRIGETQRVETVTRMPGGKGINVARVLTAVGMPARSVLPLGGASGTWIATALGDMDLAATVVPIADETRSTVTVVDDIAHPTMYGEPGPAVSADEWEAVTSAVAALLAPTDGSAPDALVVSGSLPPGTDPAVVATLVRIGREARRITVVDASGPALLAAADAGATVLKPNRDELLDATGADDERSGALLLLERGAGTVVVSRGADGIAAHTRSGTVSMPAVPGVHGNPTGAGDAATAGLVAALVEGLELPDVLARAAAFGAAAVLRPIAGEVDLAAVPRFLHHLTSGASA